MDLRKASFLLLLLITPLLVYLPTLDHELIWDSKPMILENDLLKGTFQPLKPFRMGYWEPTSQRESGYDYYRPLTVLSYMVETHLWGIAPFRLRLTNLILFIMALFLCYALINRLAADPTLAGIAVFLFALFPLHLDNITWVVARCDLLMLLFGLASLYSADRYGESGKPRWAIQAIAAFGLALLAKEAALFFLPLIMIFPVIRSRRLSIGLGVGALAMAILFWWIKSLAIGRSHIPISLDMSIPDAAKTTLGVLGYYFRSLLFPFQYDMFLAVDEVQTFLYRTAGIVFLFGWAFFTIRLRRSKSLIYPWLFMTVFLAGHLLMVFTPIFPYSISTRYLLIPIIGWTWLVSLAIIRLPQRFRFLVSILLLVAMAGSIWFHSRRYVSEFQFWQSAHDSSPGDGFFLVKYAGQLQARGDFIKSDRLLRQTLSKKVKIGTASAIAMQLAEICVRQARYDEALRWIDSIAHLPLDPMTRRTCRILRTRIHTARGEKDSALRINADTGTAISAVKRIEIHLDFADWSGARETTNRLEPAAAEAWRKRIDQIEARFSSSSPEIQARFFHDRGNYRAAWEMVRPFPSLSLTSELDRLRLTLRAGSETEARAIREKIASAGASDFRILNALGNLYLSDFYRAQEALCHFRDSLRLNPNQPGLRKTIALLDPGSDS